MRRPASAALLAGACAAWLAAALATQPHYGITWDQAAVGLSLGERSLDAALAGDPGRLDPAPRAIRDRDPGHPRLFSLVPPHQVALFGNLLSAAGCRVLHDGLGIADWSTAHHVPNFLLIVAVMVALFRFTEPRFGAVAALVACLAFAFQPRFWANAHTNTKDIPYACLMALTLLAARRGLLRRSPGWITAAAALLGLAGATKANAALIPGILAAWYALAGHRAAARSGGRGAYAALAVAPAIAAGAALLVSPPAWRDPPGFLLALASHDLELAFSGEPGLQWKTWLLLLAVQPPALLVFGGVGVLVALRERSGARGEPLLFLVVWLFAVVGTAGLPRMLNYDGVRHLLGYAAALGALAGVGTAESLRWLAGRLRRAGVRPGRAAPAAAVAVALPFAAWAAALVALHPHEVVYFNALVGGAAGAQRVWDDATDYWGSSYRDGARWLSEHAEPNATVLVPIGGHVVGAERHLSLRSDLRLIDPNRERITRARLEHVLGPATRGPLYVMYVTRRSWYEAPLRKVIAEWPRVHAIVVDGAPILEIRRRPDGASLPAGGPG